MIYHQNSLISYDSIKNIFYFLCVFQIVFCLVAASMISVKQRLVEKDLGSQYVIFLPVMHVRNFVDYVRIVIFSHGINWVKSAHYGTLTNLQLCRENSIQCNLLQDQKFVVIKFVLYIKYCLIKNKRKNKAIQYCLHMTCNNLPFRVLSDILHTKLSNKPNHNE